MYSFYKVYFGVQLVTAITPNMEPQTWAVSDNNHNEQAMEQYQDLKGASYQYEVLPFLHHIIW